MLWMRAGWLPYRVESAVHQHPEIFTRLWAKGKSNVHSRSFHWSPNALMLRCGSSQANLWNTSTSERQKIPWARARQNASRHQLRDSKSSARREKCLEDVSAEMTMKNVDSEKKSAAHDFRQEFTSRSFSHLRTISWVKRNITGEEKDHEEI